MRIKNFNEKRMMGPSLLEVRNLSKIYGIGCIACLENTGPMYETNICPQCNSIVACSDINLNLYPGEILGIIGESGSGKSTLIKSLYFDEKATSGTVHLKTFENGATDILSVNSQKKRWLRNHQMGIVYQNASMGLRMNFSCGGNIAEKLIGAEWYNIGKIRIRCAELLMKTEMPMERMDDLPKNFSGGMQQRVQISKALANNPPLLLLDEVTTGLDVSVQVQILDLIRQIQQSIGISMIVVSHDFGVIRMLTNRTLVMKNGRIVESGLTDQIMEDPQHPYTQLLINSIL